MVAVRIGEFDRKITVEQNTSLDNPDGQPIPTWATYATRWAKRINGGGTEQVEQGKLRPSRSASWQVRYDATTAAITERMRVTFGGETWGIVRAFDPDDMRRLIQLDCEERS